MMLSTAVVPAELTEAGVTDATPGVLAMSDCMVDSRELLAELDWLGNLTTTVSGPFTPTPKPWEIRSYACRFESVVGLVPLSGWPSVIENSGMASNTSTPTLAIAHGQGRPETIRPHRANALCSCRSCVAADRKSTRL